MFIAPSIVGPTNPANTAPRSEAAVLPALPALTTPLESAQPVTARAATPAMQAQARGNTNKNPYEDTQARVAIQQLQARDREVRFHEQAHMAAAGGLLRAGPFFSFVIGPDGKRYAVGGSVEIDTSEVPGDPEATIEKARRIAAAALAPAEPSGADLAAAQKAARMETEARMEIARRDASTAYGNVAAPPQDPRGRFLELAA